MTHVGEVSLSTLRPLIGELAYWALVQNFGGLRIYLPAKASTPLAKGNRSLETLIGPVAAQALLAEHARSYCQVPRESATLRKKAVEELIVKYPVDEVAFRLGVHRRTVFNLLDKKASDYRYDDPAQPDLLKQPKKTAAG